MKLTTLLQKKEFDKLVIYYNLVVTQNEEVVGFSKRFNSVKNSINKTTDQAALEYSGRRI